MSTNEPQHSPAEEASDALDFMKEVKKTGSETNHEKNHYQYGLNTCLHLSLQTKLPPKLIFIGKQNGRIRMGRIGCWIEDKCFYDCVQEEC